MKLKIFAAVLAGLLLTGIGAAATWASIPDSGGVIHACYKPQSDGHSSTLGVIDTALPNGHCPSGQTELTWNQTGPQGPAGPPGLAGVHVVTASVSTSARVECPSGETALAITFSQAGQIFSITYSAVPVFAADGVTPIGYDVTTSASSASSAHLTCAVTS
jgi:hypothetical protein